MSESRDTGRGRRLLLWCGVAMAVSGALGAAVALPPDEPGDWFQLICFCGVALCGLALLIATGRRRATDPEEGRPLE